MPPGTPTRIRASHAEREATLDVLQQAFVRGRISPAELSARQDVTLRSRYRDELGPLMADATLNASAQALAQQYAGNGKPPAKPAEKVAEKPAKAGENGHNGQYLILIGAFANPAAECCRPGRAPPTAGAAADYRHGAGESGQPSAGNAATGAGRQRPAAGLRHGDCAGRRAGQTGDG